MPRRKRQRPKQFKPETATHAGERVPKRSHRPRKLTPNVGEEFPNFSRLPVELRLRVWEYASSLPRIYFVKLLWAEHCTLRGDQWPGEYRGHHHASTRGGNPIFTRATFPGFERLARDSCPPENALSLEMGHSYKRPEVWWDRYRPTNLSYNPAPVSEVCREARRVFLSQRGHCFPFPILNQSLDETKRSDYDFRCGYGPKLMRNNKPLKIHDLSWLSLNPSSDLICLQVDITPSLPKPALWQIYPEFVLLKQLAVEFHGPTTRDWCPSCAERRHIPGEPRKSIIHQPDCMERIRDGSDSGFANIHSLSEILIGQFPAVNVIYLVDWGMKPLANVRPDLSDLRFASNEYDFFEVRNKEEWEMMPTPERPCPFESLDCAKHLERAIPKRQRQLQRRQLRLLQLFPDGVADHPPEVFWRKEDKFIRCSVLAAVPRKVKREYRGPLTRSRVKRIGTSAWLVK